MKIRSTVALFALALGGCAGQVARPGAAAPSDPIEVGILAINDFHGNLQPPKLAIEVPRPGAAPVQVPAGGAAYLAAAVARLRSAHPNSITVSAGDMTSASPLASSLFLDEPTVTAMNAIGVDLNAVGNHEFDRGIAELKRLQDGGCDQHTKTAPCQIEPFAGARFRYLAGNTITPTGDSLLPGTALRSFGEGARKVTIGFIGLTTRTTGSLVDPAGIPGITFADEAATANALVPQLRAAGADTIVLLIHEGGYPKPETDPNACEGLSGPIREIAEKLDPAIDTVLSGHTHKAYVCELPRPGGAPPVLLSSAGRYGTLVTDVTLRFDPATKKLVGQSAQNVVVQSEAFTGTDGKPVMPGDAAPRLPADPAVAALVDRYVAAAQRLSDRPVGRLSRTPLPRASQPYESEIGNLIADAELAGTAAPDKGGAAVALMNPGGIRADLKPAPDGTITFGDIYAVQPFGNKLVVREYSGVQLRAILEQQFDRASPMVLNVAGLTYAFDRSRPVGQRVLDVKVQGRPLAPAASYRVAVSTFLVNGGDSFTTLAAGKEVREAGLDLDLMEAYLAKGVVATPSLGRVVDRTPANWSATH